MNDNYFHPTPQGQPVGPSAGYCPNCGTAINPQSTFCPNCGQSVATQQPVPYPQPAAYYPPQYAYQQPYQQPQVVMMKSPTNGLGTTGFILALLAILVSWVPGLDVLMWLLGLVFSAIGCFKQPRGLAVAGLVISLLDLIVLILAVGAVGGALAGCASMM